MPEEKSDVNSLESWDEKKKSIIARENQISMVSNYYPFEFRERFLAFFRGSHRVRLENTLSIPVLFLICEDPEALILSDAKLGGAAEAGCQYAKLSVNTEVNWKSRGGKPPLQRVSVPPRSKLDVLIKSKIIYLTFFVRNKEDTWDVLQMNRAIKRDHGFIAQDAHLVQPVAKIQTLPDATEKMVKPGYEQISYQPKVPMYYREKSLPPELDYTVKLEQLESIIKQYEEYQKD